MKHHAMSYYYACWIHYHRSLKGTIPRDIQHLVLKGTLYLEAIANFEQSRLVSGMFWPTFIIGCEAEGPELRLRIAKLFDKGWVRGLGNITSSAQVIFELWNRRDQGDVQDNICWQDVKADLGLDILLT